VVGRFGAHLKGIGERKIGGANEKRNKRGGGSPRAGKRVESTRVPSKFLT